MKKKQIIFLFLLFLILEEVQAKKPRNLLLSIGISHFEDKNWNQLQYASKDATSIHKKLINNKKGWNKLLVTSPKGKRKVSHIDFINALKILKKQNVDSKDIVIIYISTHGTIFQNQKTGELGRYIVTSNTRFDQVDKTALPYRYLINFFQSLKSKKKVLILDSCYSGTGKSQFSPKVKIALKKLKSGFIQEEYSLSEGEIFLFSSQKSEPSLEDRRLQHSVYTSFLLEGLRKDLNGDGAVTITEAHLYARNLTQKFSKGRQNPTARMIIEGVDPIVISGKRKNMDMAFLYNRWSAKANLLIYVDGKFKGKLKEGIPIKAGKHRVTIVHQKTREEKVDRVFRFEKGREYLIEGLFNNVNYPHTFDGEFKIHSFINTTVKNEVAPTTLLGYGIRYTHQELWKTFDLGFSFFITPENEENISLSMGSLLKQKRSQMSGQIFLGQRESLSFLSTKDGRIESNLGWSIGLSFLSLNIEKNYYSSYASKTPFNTVGPNRKTVPGINIRGQLNFTIPSVNLRSGLNIETGILTNPFDKGGNFLIDFLPSIYIGGHW